MVKFLQRLSSRLMLLALVAAIVVFIGLFIAQSFRIHDMQASYAAAQTDLQRVQDRNARLQQHLDFYNGPGYMLYVEKVARESLGMAKPNETVILPVTNEGGPLQNNPVLSGNPDTTTSKPAPLHQTNWRNWLGFFFGS